MSSRQARLRPSARSVLLRVYEGLDRGATLQAALSDALHAVPLSGDERRRATDLAYQTVRMEERATFVLESVFPRWRRFPTPLARLLLGAATSCLFQENAPVYAVVNETVSDARFLYGKALAGAANAGLRALLKLGDAPKEEGFYARSGEDPYLSFARYCSAPRELALLLRESLGEEGARRVLARAALRPTAALRLNPGHREFGDLGSTLAAHGYLPLPGRAGKKGWFLPAQPGGEKTPGERSGEEAASGQTGENQPPEKELCLESLIYDGALTRQSAGSQLALAALEDTGFPKDVPVWDACAGFGGKTTGLLEEGFNVALSSDVHAARLGHVVPECGRLGLTAPRTLLTDASRPPFDHWEGAILCDVPCTGLGVLGKRPDIKRRMPDTAHLVPLQKAILSRALTLVPRGGWVAYMTCTVLAEENGRLVRDVAAELGAEIAEEWSTADLEATLAKDSGACGSASGAVFEDMYLAVLRRA